MATTALKEIESLTAADLFQNNTSEALIGEIRAEALSLVPDISTDAGRKQIIAQAAKVAKTKVAIEKVGKALVDPMKKAAKVIDQERKLYKDELDALRDEVREPVTNWEREQDAIKQAIKQRIFDLEQAGITTSPNTGEVLPVESLERKLRFLEMEEVTVENYGDDFNESEVLRAAGINRVKGAIQQRKDADELQALREEKEKRDREEAAEKEKARIEEEAVAKFKAKQEAAEKAKEAEKPAPAPEPTPAPEPSKDAKREAMNNAFMALRQMGIGKDDAQMIVKAIDQGVVTNVTLNY